MIIFVLKRAYYIELQNALQIVFTVLTFAILAGGCYGVAKLEQDSDPIWFIPSDSYAFKYDEVKDDYFPTDGYNTAVYLGKQPMPPPHKDTHQNHFSA